jgi:hypothetical protein
MEGELEVTDDREGEEPDQEWEVRDTEGSDNEAADESSDQFKLDQEDASEPLTASESNPADSEYVERLMESASRKYESESEVDQELNGVLNSVAKEYFFGKIKRGLKKLSKNKLVRGLVQKGLKVTSGQLAALKAVTRVARGDLKGMLLNLGKQALGAAVPASTVVMNGLSSIGLESENGHVADREVWVNYLQISKDAFEHLADTLNEQVNQPLEASRLASQAFRHAMTKAEAKRSRGSPKDL